VSEEWVSEWPVKFLVAAAVSVVVVIVVTVTIMGFNYISCELDDTPKRYSKPPNTRAANTRQF
jgi:hypothetical protein